MLEAYDRETGEPRYDVERVLGAMITPEREQALLDVSCWAAFGAMMYGSTRLDPAFVLGCVNTLEEIRALPHA